MSEPKKAQTTDLKSAIIAITDETYCALAECIQGLTDAQVWACPLKDRNPIGVIAMHVLADMNRYTCMFITGEDHLLTTDYDGDGAVTPSVADMCGMVVTLKDTAVTSLQQTPNDALTGKAPYAEAWWDDDGRTMADAYIRSCMHANAHIRQIWLLRGLILSDNQPTWPAQHWA